MSIRRSFMAATAVTLERPAIQGGSMQPEDFRTKVLLVEDEVLVLDLIAEALGEGGYEVLSAASKEEALGVLETHGPTLVGLLTDINLGSGERGWDVAKRARELNPEVAVVYMSGDSAHEWASCGVPKSVMLSKPFAPAQIVVAISNLANQAEG